MTERAAALVAVEEQVQVLMRRIKRVIGERAAEVHPDLQPSSFIILGWLAENGPARGSSLVCQFHIDKGAISRQVQHLLDLGLAEREPDPADGRATLVSVSADAVAKLEAVADERRRWLDGRLSDWSEEQLALMVELLGRYNEALDDRD